jgi:hypothetical protein
MEEMTLVTVWTFGIIVEETEDCIKMCSSVCAIDEDVTLGHDTIIPKSWINEIHVITKKWWR